MTDSINSVPAVIVAGGKGERLHPVTKLTPKPLVQVGDRALLNFPVSNCLNSPTVSSVIILAQAFPNVMLDYVAATYHQTERISKPVKCKVPPMYLGPEYYAGNADAIRQHPGLLEGGHEHILVLAADQLYQVRYDDMIRQHIESGNAITAAVQRMPVTEAAGRFGVFTLGDDNQIHLEEKPSHPKPISGTSECWANLGFYVFSVEALREALNKCCEHDFGQDIIPWMINHQMKAGVREKTMYWRDLGTVADYWQAHMDLVATNSPIDLCDPNNPIIGKPHSDAPAKFSNGAQISHGSVFGPGSSVSGKIVSSVISRAKIGSDSIIEQSVILGREDKKSSTGRITRKNIVIGKGVRLKRVIILESSIVGDGVTLGENPGEETKRWPDLVIKEGPDDTQIIVVPAGAQVEL